jgi:enamine deaminase RidA (YjgF/YER057c/UK114 family)
MPAFFFVFQEACMRYLLKRYCDGVVAEISILEPKSKTKEFHVIMHGTQKATSFDQQLIFLQAALKNLLADALLQNSEPIFAHCFLSDASNQQETVTKSLTELLSCSVSYVKQPPLDGSKLALWIQLQTDTTKGDDGLVYYEHNGYRQYFTSSTCKQKATENSYSQTKELLESYEKQLKDRECTIADDCVRTWFFVRDVDLNYQGVVDARRENFELNGLTTETHYIASTGIEGCSANPNIKVLMNAHTIKGLDKGQVNFLYAKDYLNPTHEYGVTFERGASIDFGDRRKVYISGTASIDNKGMIVHPGDIEKQVYRMWENVNALLDEAACTFEDLMQMIVYLRDMADYKLVSELFERKFPTVPKVIVLAPICRPGWLIEMECIASKVLFNARYRDL